MSSSKTNIKEGLIVSEAETLTPASIIIDPVGSPDTSTTLVSSQTSDQIITLPDATDTLVGKDTTDTLTNKTISTSTNIISVSAAGVVATELDAALEELASEISSGDAALQAHINDTTDAHDASAISVIPSGNLTSTDAQSALVELQTDVDTRATSADLTAHTSASSGVHGVTGSVVGTTDTQTLSNKTLTSPIINSPTGITKADVGLANVDNTSDATKNSAVATLTNKSIGDALTFQQITTPSNPTAGSNKIYVKADNKFYTLTSAGVETEVGSGAGGVTSVNGLTGAVGITSLSPNLSVTNSSPNVQLDLNSDLATKSGTESLTNKTIAYTSTDISTVGNVNLSTPTTGIIRLTNALNIGVSSIGAGTAGQYLIIENKRVTSIIFYNENTGATAANRILTGTGDNLYIPAGASACLVYDATAQRWQMLSTQTEANPLNNLILNGNAEKLSTTGWSNYSLSESVTFQDTGDTVTLNNHGLQNGQTISFSVITSTTGISIDTLYYVISATTNTFQVSASKGGSALALTTNGSGTLLRSRPVTGTGGSGNIIFDTNSSGSTLNGNASFRYAKDANNRMGQGVSYDFSIPVEFRAKALTVSVPYMLSTGTFSGGTPTTDSDVIVYFYDVSNSKLVEPTSFKLTSNSSTVSSSLQAQVQFDSNCTVARLILHVATPSTSAYTLVFDDISVAPTNYVYGSPITDLVSAGPMIIGATTTAPTKGTTSTDRMFVGRIGDHSRIKGEYKQTAAGSAGSGDYLFTLPNNQQFDSNKVTFFTTVVGGSGTIPSGVSLGSALITDGTSEGIGSIIPYDATRFRIAFVRANSSSGADRGIVGSGQFGLNSSVISISFDFQAPILGYSSSTQMSDSADTRVVDFVASKVASQSVTANSTKLTFTSIKDSHGAFSGTDTYTVPVPGDYQVALTCTATGTGTYIAAFVNGTKIAYVSSIQTAGGRGSGYAILPNLKSGDLITIISESTTTISGTTGDNLFISRISGPSAIAATELIAASYYCSANQSASTTQAINFDTKEYDTHGAVTTGTGWRFTAPAAGLYELMVFSRATAGFQNVLYKNSSIYRYIGDYGANDGEPATIKIRLNAGETAEIRPNTSVTIIGGALTAGIASYIQITRIGL